MQELFGLPMSGLVIGLSVVLGLTACGVLLLAWRSPVLVKMGVRNIPRRRPQSVLIVLGLMLSATIIAASLGVGDIVNYSIEKEAVLALGHTDEVVRSRDFRVFGTDYFPYDRFLDVERAFAGDPRLDGIMPEVRELAPVVNTRTTRTESRMTLSGLEADRLAGFGRTIAIDGPTVEPGALGPDEALINESAAEELEAVAGDRLTIVTQRGRFDVTVGAVIEDGGIAGSRSRMLVPIGYAQRIFGHDGEINRINLSNRGDERSGAALSEEITSEVRLLFADPEVAGQMQSFLADDRNRRALQAYAASAPAGPLRDRLLKLLDHAGSAAPPPEFRSLLADPEVAVAVALAIEQDGRQGDAIAFSTQAAAIRLLTVDQIKANGLDQAQRVSDGVTRLFLIFGSFSIIVGMLLIFLIFVLLATARRTEMGITRAVGARRRQLVQVFVFEGVLYAIGASAVGTMLGVLASMLLVEFIPQSDQIGFTVVRHVEPRSVAVAFCLGLVLTVATVAVSAYRVSRLNVVAAIRGVEEEHAATSAAGMGQRASRFVARLVRQGWPLVGAGTFLMVRGSMTASAFGVRAGFMLAAIGLALMLRWILERAGIFSAAGRQRVAVTFASALLLGFWSLPFQVLFEIFGDLEGGTELFVLSGVTMVTAAVAAVMYNAQAFVWIVNRTLGRIGRLAPVLKTAIAYPMAARFRTGLTLAMFALIIFTLMVIAILTNTSQLALEHQERVTGGYEITASVPVDLPIPDIEAAVAGVPGVDRSDFESIAASINVPARARQAGIDDRTWQPISVRAVDDSFLASNLLQMAHYDPAYGSTAREIWQALRADPGLAVLNSAALPARFRQEIEVRGQRFTASGLVQEDPVPMKAFVVELTDPAGGKPPIRRTIIGVTDQLADLMG
ncbi:MAG: ABC transporter permease, partial [Chloroflexi bacterium]|nr:ABC transporter permease [Chloroflexota bacterium]